MGTPPQTRTTLTFTKGRSVHFLILVVTVSLFSQIRGYKATGTIVRTNNFNAAVDAKQLYSALKGLGTKDKIVIGILCARTNQERQMIAQQYQSQYRRSLHKHIATDTSGHYGDLMKALMTPAAEYDAAIVNKAIKGFGTNFDLLIEIILTRTPGQMSHLANAYSHLYKRQLRNDIMGDTRGDVENLLVALAEAKRDTSGRVDTVQATKDAQLLANAGVKKWGTDKGTFINILATRGYQQLDLTFQKYEDLVKSSIETSVRRETSGKLQKCLLVLVECIRNPSSYFARKLHSALKEAASTQDGVLGGTDEDTLVRIFATRSEVDMVEIKNDYAKLYPGKTLENHLRRDVHGKFQDGLLGILKGNRPFQ